MAIHGISVELLQSTLKKIGYYVGEIDGIFGTNTRDFVYKFQNDFGLKVDGIVGERTWNKLMPYIDGTVGRIVPTDMSYPFWIMQMNIRDLKVKYDFLQVETMGRSVQGKNLFVIRLGNGPKEVFYSASMHANEWINSPVLMKFVEDYAEAYVNNRSLYNQNIRELFERVSIYVAPMVNPDGVDLVVGALDTNTTSYENAKEIASSFPNIPFPDGWKANILRS